MRGYYECSQLSLRGKLSDQPRRTVLERCPAYTENKDEPILYEYTSVLIVQESKEMKHCNRRVESFLYV